MNILYGVLIYILGIYMGFMVTWWISRKSKQVGTIFITGNEDKRVYTLELEDYPDEIRFKNKVVFKVDASDLEAPEKSFRD
jgi:hypothetical protein